MTIEMVFGDYVRDVNDSCFSKEEDGRCVEAELRAESESPQYVRYKDEYILLSEAVEAPANETSRPATEGEDKTFRQYFSNLVVFAKSIYGQFRLNVYDDSVALVCEDGKAKAYFERVGEGKEKLYFTAQDSNGDKTLDAVTISSKDGQLTFKDNYVTQLQTKIEAIAKRIAEKKC